jgi:thiaminase
MLRKAVAVRWGPGSARGCGAARQGSVGSRHLAQTGFPAARRTPVVAVALVVSVVILRGVLDPLWTAATRHPFLDAVREGTITDLAFDRWLGQDALFVGDLLTFQARLLARAPRPAQAMLAGGCVALVAELDWFEVQAARRGIDLGQPALPATLAYGELLLRLDAAPYDVAVTALWVLERVYLLAWASAASSTSPFGEFVEHWAAPGFAGYVDALGELAILDGQDDLVGDVLSHEVAFWDMALA